MDILKETGHFGDVKFTCVSDGDTFAPIVILRKAPLKYYDPARDKEDKNDKSKADVVYAFVNGDWEVVGWTEYDTEVIDLVAIEKMVLSKITE